MFQLHNLRDTGPVRVQPLSWTRVIPLTSLTKRRLLMTPPPSRGGGGRRARATGGKGDGGEGLCLNLGHGPGKEQMMEENFDRFF